MVLDLEGDSLSLGIEEGREYLGVEVEQKGNRPRRSTVLGPDVSVAQERCIRRRRGLEVLALTERHDVMHQARTVVTKLSCSSGE